jgi:hypothetical protein
MVIINVYPFFVFMASVPEIIFTLYGYTYSWPDTSWSEWSASLSDYLTSEEEAQSIQWIGQWACPRPSLNVKMRKSCPPEDTNTDPLALQPAASHMYTNCTIPSHFQVFGFNFLSHIHGTINKNRDMKQACQNEWNIRIFLFHELCV